MTPHLSIAKAGVIMTGAALINLAAVVADVAAQPSSTMQFWTLVGVFFSSACSVAAVLLTHHVKVIVNSRMSEMVKMAGESGELKEKKAAQERKDLIANQSQKPTVEP